MATKLNGVEAVIQYFGLIELQFDIEWVVPLISQLPAPTLSFPLILERPLIWFRLLTEHYPQQN